MARPKLLTEAEVQVIAQAVILGADGQGLSMDDLKKATERAIDWAQDVRIDMGLLQLVLSGELVVSFEDGGEPSFRAPAEELDGDIEPEVAN